MNHVTLSRGLLARATLVTASMAILLIGFGAQAASATGAESICKESADLAAANVANYGVRQASFVTAGNMEAGTFDTNLDTSTQSQNPMYAQESPNAQRVYIGAYNIGGATNEIGGWAIYLYAESGGSC